MRVAVICFAYTPRNLPLQPWRYISEIIKGLTERGCQVSVITDTPTSAKLDDQEVIPVASVRLTRSGNRDLERALDRLQPDTCLWNIGLTSALYFAPERLRWPSYGLFTSPVYALSELLKLGPARLYQAKDQAAIHLLGSGIPRAMIRRVLLPLAGVVTESGHSAVALKAMGIPEEKIHHIPPGIDEAFRQPLAAPAIGDAFTVLYLGSPLPIRGIFDLVEAVGLARKEHSGVHLRILSRGWGEYDRYERRLSTMIERLGLSQHATIRSGFLNRTALRDELSHAHLVALPFQMVPSDVPLAVLESMALGRPVLGTKVGSLPEYLGEGRGYLAKPGDPASLASCILAALKHPDQLQATAASAQAYARQIPAWREVATQVAQVIQAPEAALA